MNPFIFGMGFFGFVGFLDLLIFSLEDNIQCGIWAIVNLIIFASFLIIWRIDEFNQDMEPIKYLISGGKNER